MRIINIFLSINEITFIVKGALVIREFIAYACRQSSQALKLKSSFNVTLNK